MQESQAKHVVTRFWHALQARDFATAGACLTADVDYDLPQSGERFRGRANVIAVNQYYPGDWQIAVHRVIADGAAAVSEITVTIAERVDTGLSFFTLTNGSIARITDYWPEPFPAAAWRVHWAEPTATNGDPS